MATGTARTGASRLYLLRLLPPLTALCRLRLDARSHGARIASRTMNRRIIRTCLRSCCDQCARRFKLRVPRCMSVSAHLFTPLVLYSSFV
jgi:hypothetical protein